MTDQLPDMLAAGLVAYQARYRSAGDRQLTIEYNTRDISPPAHIDLPRNDIIGPEFLRFSLLDIRLVGHAVGTVIVGEVATEEAP
jgi:hypothetical protein